MQHSWLVSAGILVGTIAVAWVVAAPLIWVALVIGQHRREKARKIAERIDVYLDGVDVDHMLEREGRNGGTR